MEYNTNVGNPLDPNWQYKPAKLPGSPYSDPVPNPRFDRENAHPIAVVVHDIMHSIASGQWNKGGDGE